MLPFITPPRWSQLNLIIPLIAIFVPICSKTAVLPIYKTPHSRFQSGHATESALKAKTLRQKEVWWALVKWQNKRGWVLIEDLLFKEDFSTPVTQIQFDRPDFRNEEKQNSNQYAFTLANTILYEKPSTSSVIHALLNAKTQLHILPLNKDSAWFKVKFGKLTGYVMKNQAISKNLLNESTGKNLYSTIVSGNGTVLFKETNLFSETISEIPSKEVVSIEQTKMVLWSQSQLEDFGLVWWENNQVKKKANLFQFKDKPIFDLVTLPNKQQMLSADGIYVSKPDGWERIEFFGLENYPLAVSENGKIFVGPYLSDDSGRSFHSYINWQNFMHALDYTALDGLKLREIDIKDQSGRIISIVAQINKLESKLFTTDGGKTWQAIK